MVKYIFFDLDDTLFDFKAAEKRAIDKTLTELSVPHDEMTLKRYSEINKMCWEKLERGELTKPQVLSTRFNILFSELNQNIEALTAQHIYETALGEGHIFIDGAEQLLKDLYGKYRLYLVSNGTAKVQASRLKSSGIEKYFEQIFISEKIGANKPSKDYFDKVFSMIDNFEKEKSIIVGDSLTSDILGGINAGIKTVLFDPKNEKHREDIVPDFRIQKLADLQKLIEKI